jgi:hypothetical protein
MTISARSAEAFLDELRALGATRTQAVRFRNNRSTYWSLTRRATVLNLHEAYRSAPDDLVRAFAILVMDGGIRSARSRRAADRVGSWPGVTEAVRRARAEHKRRATEANGPGLAHCCSTPAQRAYLRACYRYLNATRFEGRLPENIPLRLSSRMSSALGHMLPEALDDGTPYVAEIALNVDLMLEENASERFDTLLHEMAHAADYLLSGGRGHGASWRSWARRVGCAPSARHDRPLRRRSPRGQRVDRCPPLPAALVRAGLSAG